MSDKLREALKAVEPYLDAITCYASTVKEHEGNRVAALVRAALAQPQNDLLLEDLREMLRALGMFDGAQPTSPHEVFQEAIAEMKRQLSAQPQNDQDAGRPLRLCGYCETWNSKPCGDQCRLRTTDPTFEDETAPPSSRMRRASPDDIRSVGWSVAVHNDYRINGKRNTFWLFTKDGRAIKGEGRTDADALDAVREALRAGDNHASDASLYLSRPVCRCLDDRSRELCLDKDKCRPMTRALTSDGKESDDEGLCIDCPPVGYETDRTRCTSCPRRDAFTVGRR